MILERYEVEDILNFPESGLLGRTKIFSNVQKVTRENVVEVLERSLAVHCTNVAEIDYLYGYYKGSQDIQYKLKYVRENINNKVVVNRANEIVTFKTAFLLSEPVQYISIGGKKTVSNKVNRLNELMRYEDKDAKDKEIVDWMHIAGVAPRFVLPDPSENPYGAPFEIFTLDPRVAYVVYNSGIGEKPLCGVILQMDENNNRFASIYTDTEYFEVHPDGERDIVVKHERHNLGGIPLIEYCNGNTRMGAFESVIAILNAINQLESDALDSIDDFVNGFDVFKNCDIDDDVYGSLSIGGQAIKIKTSAPGYDADVFRITSELSQSGTQTRIDDLTSSYLEICGMPNRNGGSSTSDTGTAVLLRDGFAEAASRARDTELCFKRAERQFLKIVLSICSAVGELSGLEIKDIGTEFLRNNLQNTQSKAQVLCELLNNSKIHPKLAFEAAGLFKDNEDAYRISMEYYEQNKADTEEKLRKDLENARQATVQAGGQDDSKSEQGNDSESGAVQTESSEE